MGYSTVVKLQIISTADYPKISYRELYHSLYGAGVCVCGGLVYSLRYGCYATLVTSVIHRRYGQDMYGKANYYTDKV